MCKETFLSGNLWQIITALSSFIMAIAACIALVSYKINQKSQYLSTIESCSKEYRGYMQEIQMGFSAPTIKRDILGLFHKQLFYVENHYVPVNIKIEWLKTMYSVVAKNCLAEDTKTNFKETFGANDWANSFERVREFMSKEEKLTADKNRSWNETEIYKKVLKHYKCKYFTSIQRICLLWNSQWRKAFPL